MNRFLKSTPPMSRPTGGMITSLTSDVTMPPNAAPMTTPTARSTTLPLRENSLNSLSMAGEGGGAAGPRKDLAAGGPDTRTIIWFDFSAAILPRLRATHPIGAVAGETPADDLAKGDGHGTRLNGAS